MYESGSINMTSTGVQITGSIPDVSVISTKMTLVQKLITENRDIQGLLGQRLHAILRPSAPEAGNTQQNGNPRPPTSPLVDDLEQFAAALQQLISGYQDILNRIEL